MSRGKHMKLIIGVDGTCQVDANDFSGPLCKVATEEIAAALGGRIDHQHDKPEARIRERCGDREREGAR